MAELRPEQYELLVEALRKSFWFKGPFVTFLIRCGVPRARAQSVYDFPHKTAFIRDLVDQAEQSSEGRKLLRSIAVALSRKKNFTALQNEQDVAEAKQAVALLRESFDDLTDELASVIKAQSDQVNRVPLARHAELRAGLSLRLNTLFPKLGSADAGYEFENLICDLAMSEDLETTRPYRDQLGQQIDGSIEVNGTVYLLESRFRDAKAETGDISKLIGKAKAQSDLTQGLFISMGGYTGPAKNVASMAGSPVVLLDSEHVTNCVFGGYSFERIVSLAKRHASDTGKAFYSWREMKSRLEGHMS